MKTEPFMQPVLHRKGAPSGAGPDGGYAVHRPTPASRRIASLDVLRGFALLGILVLNIDTFGGPMPVHDVPIGTAKPGFTGWHAGLDLVIFAVKWIVFEGKMRTLFSMLFGAGIILLTQRFEQRGEGRRGAKVYIRRNLWLLAFGLVHGILIWKGDILTHYALVALLVMYPLRRLGATPLLVIGLVVGIGGGTIGVMNITGARAAFAAERLEQQAHAAQQAHRTLTKAEQAALAAAAKQRSGAAAATAAAVSRGRRPYLQSVAPRAASFLHDLPLLFSTGYILELVGSMMVGMGLFKLGFLSGRWSIRAYAVTACLGYAIAVPIVLTGILLFERSGFAAPALIRWLFLPYEAQVFPGAIANAALILLVWKARLFERATAALANVGRTAFTNYIATSLLCQFLFAWGPWKLFGAIEYYQQLYVVAAVWAIILTASHLWLRAFAYGPLEWLWRSLVYGQRQPLRRAR